MNGERIRIWIALFIASTVWGSTWLAIKLGLQTVPPFLAIAVRFALASVLLWIVIRIRKLSIPRTQDAKKAYLSMALLTFTVPFALVYWGQQFIPSALGSILFAAFPFWVALFAHFMTDEKLDSYKLTGIVCGFSGVVVVFGADFLMADSRALVGMGAIAFSVIIQALSLLQVKKWGEEVDPFVLNFVGMLIAMVALFVLWWLLESDRPVVWGREAVFSVLYLALVGSVVAFVAYYWLLKRIEAVYLSLTSFINPIVAVVLGAVVLTERLAPSVFVGAVLVFAGILIANWKHLYAKLVPRE
jgi:drug/metabolite transporter (DMT)-like permease